MTSAFLTVDRGIGHGGAGNGNELPLALGEVRAVVGEHGVVALGQAHDEVVRARKLRRPAALLVRRVESAVADIVQHRAGEEVRLLQHKAQGAAQIGLFDLVDVDAVIADLAVGNVVEAVNEVRDRGLARAGRANEGHLLPGLRVDGHVVQHVLALFIGKVHVHKAHVALEGGVGQRAVPVRVPPGPFAGALLRLREAAVLVLRDVYQRHIARVRLPSG